MKASCLKPGQEVRMHGRKMLFIQRLRHGREIAGRSVNVFTCQDFVGLNGPKDDGRVEVSDQMFYVLTKEGR
jgi:hypothetical protein